MAAHTTISATDAHRALNGKSGGVLIDVRTPAEFRGVHAIGATNIPLNIVSANALPAGRPIYVLCRTGARAEDACKRLAAENINGLVLVDGGTEAWIAAGLPTEQGRKTVSLERQVRITAGSLVFIGTLLAAFVHPWFWALPAFIGGGLVFSGVTDTCGMGMVLARMPWNQAKSDAVPISH